MKNILLFALIWSLNHACLQAQNKQKYTIHPGEIMIQVIPATERMHYEHFQPGSVLYYDGKSAALTLNYSYLPGEMQFIGPKGDTLAMVDDPLVKSIRVGEDVFHYLPGTGYLQVLSDTYPVKLVQKQIIKIIKGDPQSEYESSPVTTPSNIFGPSQATISTRYAGPRPSNHHLYRQPAPKLILLARQVSFYLMDKNQRFYKIKKSMLFKLFPAYRKTIRHYVQEHHINFKRKEDLINLLEFCSQLQSNHISGE